MLFDDSNCRVFVFRSNNRFGRNRLVRFQRDADLEVTGRRVPWVRSWKSGHPWNRDGCPLRADFVANARGRGFGGAAYLFETVGASFLLRWPAMSCPGKSDATGATVWEYIWLPETEIAPTRQMLWRTSVSTASPWIPLTAALRDYRHDPIERS